MIHLCAWYFINFISSVARAGLPLKTHVNAFGPGKMPTGDFFLETLNSRVLQRFRSEISAQILTIFANSAVFEDFQERLPKTLCVARPDQLFQPFNIRVSHLSDLGKH